MCCAVRERGMSLNASQASAQTPASPSARILSGAASPHVQQGTSMNGMRLPLHQSLQNPSALLNQTQQQGQAQILAMQQHHQQQQSPPGQAGRPISSVSAVKREKQQLAKAAAAAAAAVGGSSPSATQLSKQQQQAAFLQQQQQRRLSLPNHASQKQGAAAYAQTVDRNGALTSGAHQMLGPAGAMAPNHSMSLLSPRSTAEAHDAMAAPHSQQHRTTYSRPQASGGRAPLASSVQQQQHNMQTAHGAAVDANGVLMYSMGTGMESSMPGKSGMAPSPTAALNSNSAAAAAIAAANHSRQMRSVAPSGTSALVVENLPLVGNVKQTPANRRLFGDEIQRLMHSFGEARYGLRDVLDIVEDFVRDFVRFVGCRAFDEYHLQHPIALFPASSSQMPQQSVSAKQQQQQQQQHGTNVLTLDMITTLFRQEPRFLHRLNEFLIATASAYANVTGQAHQHGQQATDAGTGAKIHGGSNAAAGYSAASVRGGPVQRGMSANFTAKQQPQMQKQQMSSAGQPHSQTNSTSSLSQGDANTNGATAASGHLHHPILLAAIAGLRKRKRARPDPAPWEFIYDLGRIDESRVLEAQKAKVQQHQQQQQQLQYEEEYQGEGEAPLTSDTGKERLVAKEERAAENQGAEPAQAGAAASIDVSASEHRQVASSESQPTQGSVEDEKTGKATENSTLQPMSVLQSAEDKRPERGVSVQETIKTDAQNKDTERKKDPTVPEITGQAGPGLGSANGIRASIHGERDSVASIQKPHAPEPSTGMPHGNLGSDKQVPQLGPLPSQTQSSAMVGESTAVASLDHVMGKPKTGSNVPAATGSPVDSAVAGGLPSASQHSETSVKQHRSSVESVAGGSGYAPFVLTPQNDLALVCSMHAARALQRSMLRQYHNDLQDCRQVSFVRDTGGRLRNVPRVVLFREWLSVSTVSGPGLGYGAAPGAGTSSGSLEHSRSSLPFVVEEPALCALGHVAWEALGTLTQSALLVKYFDDFENGRGDPRAAHWSRSRHVLAAVRHGIATAVMAPLADVDLLRMRDEIDALDSVGIARWKGFGRSGPAYLSCWHVEEALRRMHTSHKNTPSLNTLTGLVADFLTGTRG
ncbi:hypothetical protein FVE85_7008 [Porphyridium purpureum]|uniref:Uncharacterized protein n=1 Tax=Porphyridium purpureum TaxID=35688 RepID=A0A5J4Z9J1_PORPP|nr:hypothetical protein FVE85_7008 [Porphyridium purpureum]|eukprot:POR2432..scf295_1